MFDPAQIETLRNSALILHHSKDEAASTFYDTLFEIAPELRALFPPQTSDQARKFAATLVVAVNALSTWDALLPIVEALARRHLAYGVEPAHYRIVEQALIETLKTCGASAAEKTTWRMAYRALADHMIAVAYPDPE